VLRGALHLRRPAQGKPNTFIWGFRAVGGRPIIPPSLTLSPNAATAATGTATDLTATLRDESGSPVPGAKLVFSTAGANPGGAQRTSDAAGQASFSYVGANAGSDTVTACLDSNGNGACDPGEVAAAASRTWQAPQPPPVIEPPAPVQGKSVVAGKVSGTIRIRLKNGKFKTLGANESIPLGSTIDATKGRVRLTSAAGGGKTQTGDFYKGQFKITQTKGKKPITQLALNAALSCGKAGKASTARKKKKVRSLWGDGHGSFRTKGRRAAATVRGTKWFTQDTCDYTKVSVKRGIVDVRDFARHKTVKVKKGHSYVARKKKKK
jgi:hypothetical protein